MALIKSLIKKDNSPHLTADKWLNIKSVSNYTSLSPSTIRRAVSRGSLKVSKITGKLLFKVSAVDRWLNG